MPDRSSHQDDEELQEISADLVCGPDAVLTLDNSMASTTIVQRSDETKVTIKEPKNALEKEQRDRYIELGKMCEECSSDD